MTEKKKSKNPDLSARVLVKHQKRLPSDRENYRLDKTDEQHDKVVDRKAHSYYNKGSLHVDLYRSLDIFSKETVIAKVNEDYLWEDKSYDQSQRVHCLASVSAFHEQNHYIPCQNT